LLARLDPADLSLQAQAARAQLAAAEGQLRRASAERARYATLAEDQLVSRSASDAQEAAHAAALGEARAARANLEAARNQVAYSQLRAPDDGVIVARAAEAGQVVAAGQPVFTLAADGPREVEIAVPESAIGGFSVGRPALVELWSARGRRLPGRVRDIAPAAYPRTRSYAARVALPASADVELGQSARVYFEPGGDGGDATMTVPLAALQRGEDGATAVWTLDPATRALHLHPVQVGAFDDDRVPVLRGLQAGDWIVAAGGHLLREGQVVAPVDRDNRPLPAAAKRP
jgi:multidrug efflux system membrane fusion protein